MSHPRRTSPSGSQHQQFNAASTAWGYPYYYQGYPTPGTYHYYGNPYYPYATQAGQMMYRLPIRGGNPCQGPPQGYYYQPAYIIPQTTQGPQNSQKTKTSFHRGDERASAALHDQAKKMPREHQMHAIYKTPTQHPQVRKVSGESRRFSTRGTPTYTPSPSQQVPSLSHSRNPTPMTTGPRTPATVRPATAQRNSSSTNPYATPARNFKERIASIRIPKPGTVPFYWPSETSLGSSGLSHRPLSSWDESSVSELDIRDAQINPKWEDETFRNIGMTQCGGCKLFEFDLNKHQCKGVHKA